MLYIMTIVKLILPLVTLPYLTRILSLEAYGVVSYVKSCMVYMQIVVDFGFLLSAVKDIVLANGDKEKIGFIAGHTYLAKVFLALGSLIVLSILCCFIPLLRENLLFTFLSFAVVAISVFLGDFLFRGIEKMHIITIVFLVMKGLSTALTFVVVHSDADILWIPILDIISSVLAVAITWIWIRKLHINIKIKSIKDSLLMLKESFVYFISSMATTAFGALNTVLIGIFIKDTQQIAFWSIALQLISAVQNLYSPILNGIYPQMVKTKDLGFIKKLLLIFMPIVVAGCIFCYFLAKPILVIIAGQKYADATLVFRCLIPVLLFSFPGMMLGWPTLGPIGKEKETTWSTVITAIVQCLGLVVLILFHQFTLPAIALLRGGTELLMLILRGGCVFRFRAEFIRKKSEEEENGAAS